MSQLNYIKIKWVLLDWKPAYSGIVIIEILQAQNTETKGGLNEQKTLYKPMG